MIITLIIIIFQILGAVSSVSALMGTRTSQGTIAWIISLNTFPYIAVPAYWIFGRSKFHGYHFTRTTYDTLVNHMLKIVHKDIISYSEFDGRVEAVEQLAKMPFTRHNHAQLLINGAETFDSIFTGIEKAEEYILLQFYIVHPDELGNKLQSHLTEKSKQGVKVYFLYDEIGSYNLPQNYIRKLIHAGIHVSSFKSNRGFTNRFQLNFRNHRKIVVVDGKEGWLGGHNVGDEYLGKDPRFGPWRDTHLKLEGPAVMGLQISFIEDWAWAQKELLELNNKIYQSAENDYNVLILPSGPADKMETASLMYQHLIHSAEKRFWVASPYFVPDEGVMAALKLARLRGVDVRIIIPNNPDHFLVYFSAFAFLGEILDAGIKVYRYTPGFFHGKGFLVDNRVSGIGTVNMDNRSFRLNFEITCIIIDQGFAEEIGKMFLDDFVNSRLMEPDEIRNKPYWFKIISRAARLLAPIQ